MITQKDILEEINHLLKEKYGYKVYGIEVSEGYKKPSFFVDLRLTGQTDESANMVRQSYNVSIVYFQRNVNEIDCLDKAEGIRQCLISKDVKNTKKKMMLKVKDRYISVEGFETGYIGRNNNILQINFDLAFTTLNQPAQEGELIKAVKVNQEMEE